MNLRQLDQNKIEQVCGSREIEWHFNPPHASHFGGAWERLIRSIRRVLKSICDQQVFGSDEVLLTLMCEVEAIINARPLSRISDDPECETPISPSMLLTLKNASAPIYDTDPRDIYSLGGIILCRFFKIIVL